MGHMANLNPLINAIPRQRVSLEWSKTISEIINLYHAEVIYRKKKMLVH